MPLVRITLRTGRTEEFLRDAGQAIHEALVAEAAVPPDDLFQIFDVVPQHALVAHPTYGGVERSDALIVVEIILNAGRSVETKKALYGGITRRLQSALDIRPDDVMICLVEVTKENWSFGGGRATYA